MDPSAVDWKLVEEIVGPIAVAAGGAGLEFFRRKFLKPMHELMVSSKTFPGLVASVTTLSTDVAEVKRQMTTNGGSTLRDDIAVIGGAVDQMSNHVETPIFRTDPSGAWSRCNEALVELVGYPVEELVQMGWVNVIAEADRDRVMASLEYARRDRRKFRVPAKIETRAGVKFDAVLTGNPKIDGSTGRVLAWFGSIETVRATT